MNKQSFARTLWCYLWITVGSVIYAIGFDWMFVPNHIGSGGVTAIGQILNHFIPGLPIGMVVLVINIPLFLLGWRFLGGHLLVSSLYAMAATSILVDLFAALISFQPMDPLLASVFGGVLVGLALGMVFSQGATTGGTDLIARLLKLPFAWLPMGKLLLGVDLVMLIAVGIAFQNLNSALYGLISLYISSIIMDWVLYGMDSSKVAYIISAQSEEICAAIVRQMGRGVTILPGRGAYSGEEKKVLMCAFKQREIAVIKAAVKGIDPDAFLIVCPAHEILGEGFREYKKDDL